MATLVVERGPYEENYTRVNNGPIGDKVNVGYDDLGMLVYILSKPPGWKLREKDLERVRAKRDKVYRILQNLRRAGLARRSLIRDKAGKIEEVRYIVSDRRNDPLTALPDTVKPDPAKPDAGDRTLSKTDCSNTEGSNTEKEPVASLPGGVVTKKPNPHGRFANILIDEYCKRTGRRVPDGQGPRWGKNARSASASIIAGSAGLAVDAPEELLRRAAKKIVGAYVRIDKPFYVGHPFLKFCMDTTISECLAIVAKEMRRE